MPPKAPAKGTKKKASAKPKKKAGAENNATNPTPGATPDPKADKPKRPPKKKWPVIRERILARHDFATAELADYGQQIGRIDQDIALLQRDAQDVAKDFKAKIEVKTTTRTALSQKLSNGYEMRERDAIVLFDTKKREKRFVDPHNKTHVFKTEPMTENDWQLEMFRPKATAKPPKPGAGNVNEKPPADKPTLAPEILEAATALGKVELDIDALLAEAPAPEVLCRKFGTAAKKVEWPKKITKAVQQHAMKFAENGIGEVADALKPFIVDKNAST